MGEAIVSGLSNQNIKDITIVEIVEARRKYLKNKFPHCVVKQKLVDLKGFDMVCFDTTT